MDENIWDSKIDYLKMTRKHFWNDDYFEFLVKVVWKLDKPINVIDFGCGYEYLGIKLLPLLPQGSTYTGIDLSEELLKDAEQIFKNLPFDANFINVNLVEYVPKEKYDLAICQAVLRHIPQYKLVLEKMVNSVIDNGKVICIEVNRRMENAGLYTNSADFRIDEKDLFVKRKWEDELNNGGRDYLAGIKVPILMESLGLRDVQIRVNDYVEFISPNQDKDEYEEHLNSFIEEHGLVGMDRNENGVSALNARSLLISFGTK